MPSLGLFGYERGGCPRVSEKDLALLSVSGCLPGPTNSYLPPQAFAGNCPAHPCSRAPVVLRVKSVPKAMPMPHRCYRLSLTWGHLAPSSMSGLLKPSHPSQGLLYTGTCHLLSSWACYPKPTAPGLGLWAPAPVLTACALSPWPWILSLNLVSALPRLLASALPASGHPCCFSH